MPKAKVQLVSASTDYIAALADSAATVTKSSKSDITTISPPDELLPTVDRFIELKGQEDNLKRDLASARSTLVRYAAPEIIQRCETIKALESSLRLRSSGQRMVLVTERQDYSALADASIPAVMQIVGSDFDRLFARETKISVTSEATRNPQFMAGLVQLSAACPGCLELKQSVLPTRAYHHARIFESKVAGVRKQLELLQVVPVYAVKVE